MGYDDRYGGRGGRSYREENRGWQSRGDQSRGNWDRGDERWRDRSQERWSGSSYGRGDDRWSRGREDDDRGFFGRAGDEVRSWFGGDDDDRERGYRGGGRDTRWRDEDRERGGGSWFGGRDDEDDDRRSWFGTGGGDRGGGGAFGGGDGRGDNFGGGGGIGSADFGRGYGPGYDPNFGGPRFDRADVGSTGTHGVHPVASAFGANSAYGASGIYGAGGSRGRDRAILEQARRNERGSQQRQGFSSGRHDPHYSEWRRRQIEALDRDYDDYRREHQSKFEQEFGGWREKRGQQRSSLSRVTEHMEVLGSDGQHIGTVDKVRGDKIILTKSDPDAGGRHHSIPCSWIESVDDKVRVNRTADQAKSEWQDAERDYGQGRGEDGYNRALFERSDQGEGGPHMLNRSFSGTYSDDDR